MILGLFEMRRPELRVGYDQAQRLFRTAPTRAVVGLAIATSFAAVAVLGNRGLIIGLGLGVGIIGALGLQVLIGFTGQISLGHATFLGVGFYTAVALSPGTYQSVDRVLGSLPAPLSWAIGNAAGWPLVGGLLAAGAVSALLGLLIGPTALRLKGLYLALVTLGLVFLGQHVFINWRSLTGGPQGRSFTAPAIGDFSFATPSEFAGITVQPLQKQYLLVVVVTLLALWVTSNLRRSRTGRAFQAIHDRDVAAEVIGVPVARYKLIAFGLSSFMTGVAGALYGMAINYAVPEFWDIHLSIKFIAMIIIGGGGVLGALLGATFVELLPIAIRDWIGFEVPLMTTFQFQSLLYGVAIMVFLVFEPKGLSGIWSNIRRYWRTWPFSY